MALLARLPKGQRREHIAELLWPESDRARGRRSLRQALFHLSKNVEAEIVVSDDATSTLAVNEDLLEVDVREFEAAVKGEDYERAAALYGGPFLAGWGSKLGREAEHSIEAENSRLLVGLAVAYSRLVTRSLRARRFDDATRYARAYVDLNPLDENAQATLVKTLRASGDEVGALAAFEAYQTLLGSSLQEQPDERLREMVETVREELLSGPANVEMEAEPESEPGPPAAATGSPPERAGASAAAAPAWYRTPHWRARRTLLTLVLGVVAPLVILALGLTLWNLRALSEESPLPRSEPMEPIFAVIGEAGSGELVRVDVGDGGADFESVGRPASERPAPDGQHVAVLTPAEDGWDIAVYDSDSKEEIRVTRRAGDELPAGWSPDGRYLLYWESTILGEGRDIAHRLYVWDSETGEARPLTELESRSETAAIWSPDGSRIAFVGSAGGSPDVYVIGADGTELTNISNSPAWDDSPAWSADGGRVAFVRRRDDGWSDIYTVRADGSDLRAAVEVEGTVRTPLWSSPMVLVFVRDLNGSRDLWAVDITTGEMRQLTRRGDFSSVVVNIQHARDPAWIEKVIILPDERAVSPGQHLRLTAVLLDSRGDTLPSDYDVRWTAVGDAIDATGQPGAYRVLKPGTAEVVASVGGWRADTLSLVALGLARDSVPLAFDERWTAGLENAGWRAFGQPAPYVVEGGGPDGAGFLVNNGDQHFYSGVSTPGRFRLDGGLTVEAYGRARFTGKLGQVYAIALYRELALDSAGALGTPLLEFGISGAAEDRPAEAWLAGGGRRDALPVPDGVGDWHRYALQVDEQGRVQVIVDGRLYWRAAWRLADVQEPAHVVLGYQSYETEVGHGPLRIHEGPLYTLPQIPPEVGS